MRREKKQNAIKFEEWKRIDVISAKTKGQNSGVTNQGNGESQDEQPRMTLSQSSEMELEAVGPSVVPETQGMKTDVHGGNIEQVVEHPQLLDQHGDSMVVDVQMQGLNQRDSLVQQDALMDVAMGSLERVDQESSFGSLGLSSKDF